MFDLDYDYKRINDIYDFIESNIYKRNGNTLSLASALWLYVDEKCIETIPRQKSLFAKQNMQEIKVSTEGVYKFSNKTITLKKYLEKDVFVFPDSTSNFVYVDLSSVKFPLTIRTRRDGDTINPFGMNGNMKLKKYLNSKGISKHNRDEVLLLVSDTEVLWVVGVGLSNKIGVSQTPTHVIEVVND
jgi:tRNA(Ile)-lysidine synthetase-like protein